MTKGKKNKSIEDATVSELLDDFVSPKVPSNPSESTEVSDEDYVTSMLKKDAKKILAKYRKEPETSGNEGPEEEGTLIKKKREQEPPVLSEKLSPMRRCQDCYYCVAVRTIGGSTWGNCTNSGRSTEDSPERRWIRSGLNLPCWKTKQQQATSLTS